MLNSIVLGVDIGGSHITAAQVDLAAGTIVPGTRVRETVNSGENAKNIIRVWHKVISASFSLHPGAQKKIGIAMPGPFDYELGIGLMKNQNKYDDLYGLNVRILLAASLGIVASNIKFTNDAACFMKGEAFSGAVKHCRKAAGITLGTGLGSSVYENGLTTDANLWCSPFKDGIAEDYLSTRWFTGKYYERTGHSINGVKELLELPDEKPFVTDLFNEFGNNLGIFLSSFIETTQPEAVVIGGNIANAYHHFALGMHENLTGTATNTPVFKALLGEESALVGAASPWFSEESVAIN